MLTGQPPVIGKTAIEILYKHVNENRLSLTQASLGKTFPKALEAAVDRCLARDPNNRFASVAELLTALDDVEDGRTQSSMSAGDNIQGSKKNAIVRANSQRNTVVTLVAVLSISMVVTLVGMNRKAPSASKPAGASQEPTLSNTATSTQKTNEGTANDIADKEFQQTLSRMDPQHTDSLGADQVPEFIHDQSLALLKPFIHLNSIDLSHQKYITAVGLGSITSLKNIKTLILNDTRLGDEAMPELNRMSNLKRAELAGTNVTDNGIEALSDALPIERLNLKNTQITNGVFEYIHKFKGLRTLTLDDCHQIGDDGLSSLNGLALEVLSLKGTYTSSGIFNTLKKMPSLQSLTLANCNRVMSSLLTAIIDTKTVPNLTYLDMRNCPRISEGEVEMFRKARPKCKVLSGTTEDPGDLFK